MADQDPARLTPEFLAESNSNELLAVCIAFIPINTMFVVLRILSRKYQAAKWGWDDILLAIGFINCLALSADGLYTRTIGSGRHIEWVILNRPEILPTWGKNNLNAFPTLYIWSVTWTKISILVLYLRVFTDKWSRGVCWALIVILAINPVVNMFVNVFQCSPREKLWYPSTPGHCNDIQAHFAWSTLINIVSDVIMLVIPIPVILRLQTAIHIKVGLYATFLLGSLGLFTAIFRFVTFYRIDFAVDPTWEATPLFNWCIVESSIYLVSACLLSSKPVFVQIINSKIISGTFSRLRTVTGRSSSGTIKSTRGSPNASHKHGLRNKYNNIETESVDGFGAQVESHGLEPTRPTHGGIHVERRFDVV